MLLHIIMPNKQLILFFFVLCVYLQHLVRQFQTDEDTRVAILSILAAGTVSFLQ